MVSIDPSFYNYNRSIIEGIEIEYSEAGYFPFHRNTSKPKGNKKMAKVNSFKVSVKDGHTDYKYNPTTGVNDSKVVDYVETFADFASALSEFLIYVTDEYNEDKVSLTFVPGKKK